PDTIWIAPLRNHQIVLGEGARIASRKREGLDWMADRSPHLNDGEPARQQLVGPVGEKVAQALWTRPFGVIVMNPADDLADPARLAELLIGRTQRVVEHDHLRGSGLRLHQCLHLRVIDPSYFTLVEEIAHRGLVTHEPKSVALERKVAMAPVMNDHLMRIR